MREKLNENPVAQVALVAVLALVAGYFVLSSMGGEESEEAEPAPVTAESGAEGEELPEGGVGESVPTSAAASVTAPTSRKLPAEIETAYESGETIMLLIYRPGGIDDRRVAAAADAVCGMAGVALFEAPVSEIAHYSPITGPLGINQAPALIVIRSRERNGSGAAPATVTYGFQNSSDIVQAVVDSGYRGPQLTYAPK